MSTQERAAFQRATVVRNKTLTRTKNSMTVEKACIHIAILPARVIVSLLCKMKFVLT
jgi:hypothetical protein